MRLNYMGLRATVIAVVILVSAGAVAGAVTVSLTDSSRPDVLVDSLPGTTFSPTTTEFDDRRKVDITVTFGEAQFLHSPMSGLVTSTVCESGGELRSGDAVMTIDDTKIVALATSRPLHRDLSVDDTGDDVIALQEALTDLGYGLVADGKVGPHTLRAASSLLGERQPLETLPAARLLWIPASTTAISRCSARVGDRLEVGDDVIEFPGDVQSASFTVPAGATEGERVITLADGEPSYPVNADGTVTDDAALAALLTAPASEQVSGSGNQEAASTTLTSRVVTTSWALASPLSATVLAPSSLYDVSGADACVQDSSGNPYQVRIITSEVGKTLATVTAEDGQPVELTTVTLNPDAGKACR